MDLKIKTNRLVIKAITTEYKSSLLKEIGNWEVAKWLSRVNYPYSEKDFNDWLVIASQGDLNLNIFKNNLLVGGIGLSPCENNFYELGYWIAEKYWGKGFATESVYEFLKFARNEHGYKNFKATVKYNNTASLVILKKIGFKIFGDAQIYSLSNKKYIDSKILLLEYE